MTQLGLVPTRSLRKFQMTLKCRPPSCTQKGLFFRLPHSSTQGGTGVAPSAVSVPVRLPKFVKNIYVEILTFGLYLGKVVTLTRKSSSGL